MSECMMFPKNWEKFVEDYSFKDKEEVYTNGTVLVPVFRVEQMVEHYFSRKWIPVSERLPDKDGKYICFHRGVYANWTQAVQFAKDARKFDEYAFKKQWKNKWLLYDSEYGYYAVDSITHWMPLPEPPKENEYE